MNPRHPHLPIAERAAESVKKATEAIPGFEATVKTFETAVVQRDAELVAVTKTVVESEKPLKSVSFSPNGQTLATVGDDQLLHSWDAETPIDETMQALDDVVRSGKVRYVGCSNFLAYQLARSIGRAEVLGTVGFVSVQPRYNLLFRENERELFPLCAEEGTAVIPYNPLAGGFLTGKHGRGTPTEGTRFTLGTASGRYQERYWHERMFDGPA